MVAALPEHFPVNLCMWCPRVMWTVTGSIRPPVPLYYPKCRAEGGGQKATWLGSPVTLLLCCLFFFPSFFFIKSPTCSCHLLASSTPFLLCRSLVYSPPIFYCSPSSLFFFCLLYIFCPCPTCLNTSPYFLSVLFDLFSLLHSSFCLVAFLILSPLLFYPCFLTFFAVAPSLCTISSAPLLFPISSFHPFFLSTCLFSFPFLSFILWHARHIFNYLGPDYMLKMWHWRGKQLLTLPKKSIGIPLTMLEGFSQSQLCLHTFRSGCPTLMLAGVSLHTPKKGSHYTCLLQMTP